MFSYNPQAGLGQLDADKNRWSSCLRNLFKELIDYIAILSVIFLGLMRVFVTCICEQSDIQDLGFERLNKVLRLCLKRHLLWDGELYPDARNWAIFI